MQRPEYFVAATLILYLRLCLCVRVYNAILIQERKFERVDKRRTENNYNIKSDNKCKFNRKNCKNLKYTLTAKNVAIFADIFKSSELIVDYVKESTNIANDSFLILR